MGRAAAWDTAARRTLEAILNELSNRAYRALSQSRRLLSHAYRDALHTLCCRSRRFAHSRDR
jgi:hypothetical protein